MEPRGRWLYLIVSVVGLVVYLWGFQRQPQLGALPADVVLGDLAYPVQLAEIRAASPEELRFLAEAHLPGTSVRLTESGGAARAVMIARAHSLARLVITLVCGLFFWAVCAFVFAPLAARREARAFFWLTILFGLAVMIGGIYFPGPRPWPAVLPGIVHLACLAALAPLFVQVSLTFPRRGPFVDRLPWLMPALWSLALVLVAWQTWVYLQYFARPGPAMGAALGTPQRVAAAALVLQVSVAFIFMFAGMSRLELTRERNQVKWLLWGFVLGVIPYVFLRALPRAAGLTPPFDPAFDRLFELAIPIAFVFAVVRYQFLDIDIIIRRSLIYAVLAAVTVALCLVPGVLVGRQLAGGSAAWIGALMVSIGLLSGAMFGPARRFLGRVVDRTFFKLSHDYGQVLGGLRTAAERAAGQSELAAHLAGALREALRPQHYAVALRVGGELEVSGDLPPAIVQAGWEAADAARGTVAAPSSSSLPEIEDAAFPAPLIAGGVVLVQPLREGMILLGPKCTERRFIERDIILVREAAQLAGAALERIQLVQSVAEETLARRRLDDLNRLKSDFLSRVAHDLRTPLASIGWSSENLLDGLAGDINEAQREYLQSINAAVGHLNHLVGNLLEISRMERGKIMIDTRPVDLAGVLRQVLATVRPLAAEKEVTLEFAAPAAAPRVTGNAEKLFEVGMNLVDNALKYSPPKGRVEVSMTVEAGGEEAFHVRDHGPGFPDGEVDALFAQFSQGTPSPHSQKHGFGLGLFIVKEYMQLMRGRAVAGNDPAGGARVSCYLPVAEG